MDLFFITGADALSQILTWKGVDELFDLAHFVGVSRPGVPLGENDITHLPEDKVTLLEVPALAISSTDCRERVAAGPADLVPGAGRHRPVHRQTRPVPHHRGVK